MRCINFDCIRIRPRSARSAVVDVFVTQCLIRHQSTDTQIEVLFPTLVCHTSANNSVLDDITDQIAVQTCNDSIFRV